MLWRIDGALGVRYSCKRGVGVPVETGAGAAFSHDSQFGSGEDPRRRRANVGVDSFAEKMGFIPSVAEPLRGPFGIAMGLAGTAGPVLGA